MTPIEEESVNKLIDMISSLAHLTQEQANLIASLNQQNQTLVAQLKAQEAIARSKL